MEQSGTVCEQLNARLGRRGWHFHVSDGEVLGRHQEWAPQVETLVDPGDDERLPALGIVLDFGSMPLGGERFRDVLNAEREDIFHGFGSFRLRQLREDGSWAGEITHRAFVHGYGTGTEISRHTTRAVFDRCPAERGAAIVERFLDELPRLAEVGGTMALLLQRIYQRTVLRRPLEAETVLPEVVGTSGGALHVLGSTALQPEPTYPWRR